MRPDAASTDRPHNPESFVDLHSHSTASDGALAPADVVETAARAGLAALALTDHDTLAGVAAAKEAGDRLGVRIVAGVELSLMDGEKEVHMLGLHIARVDALQAELEAVRDSRKSRAEQIVAKLNGLGVPVTIDAVFVEAAGGAVGRPHIARAMIAGGWVRDQREAFDRYLGGGRPANVEKQRISIADGIRLIHECGGLAVIAHPGQDGRRERVEPLVALGLDGLEVKHPGHSAEDTLRIDALAEFFGLVKSGGSDWHGAQNGPRVLGGMRVPAAWLDLQDARLEKRRGALVA
ncbi:MAG TPA: PHP domain-containing protein [Gemmatimonadaceae bacterium]|nr:PHP domain-containing protein [Gemmatimonadaceae bacterium]